MTSLPDSKTGKKNQILSAIGNAATRLMTEDDPAADIQLLVKDLGEALSMCRAYVFETHQNSDGKDVISQRFEWTSEGVTPQLPNEALQEILCDDPDVSDMLTTLSSGNPVLGDVDTFKQSDRQVLEAQGIQSIMIVPIFTDTEWWGFIGFDACVKKQQWDDIDVEALRTAAGLIGATIRRRRTQDELEFSEMRLRTFIDNMPMVAVQGYREDGCVHYWNKASSKIYGYSEEEAIGKNIADLIAPPEMHDHIHSTIRTAAQTGQTPPPAEHEHVRKDGTTVPVQSSLSRISLPNHPLELFNIDVDLSSLKQAQEDMRDLRRHAENIKEDEQKRIAQRIHDDFGQRLTTLTMDLTWLRETLNETNDEHDFRLASDLKIIEELLAMARDVSMELRPSVLDHFGLPAALEWAAEEIETSSQISFELNMDEELQLDDRTTLTLYRVAQELLTNIARHSEASNVRIALYQTGTKVQLNISDDGVGMVTPPTTESKSMGLLGAQEAIRSIDGKIEFDSAPQHGTTIRITVPNTPRKENEQ